jgi:hypothetical protein
MRIELMTADVVEELLALFVRGLSKTELEILGHCGLAGC